MAKPVLYSYFRSSCSWRVRIALQWKGIDYDYQAVHLIKDGGHQNTETYKVTNPMAQVPSIVINDTTYTQSIAILEYLEEAYPDKPLLPKDLSERLKVREICEIIGSGIQPLQNLSVLQKVGQEKQKEWAVHWLVKGFTALEQILVASSGKYCVGDSVTLADCCLIPQIFNARRFEVDLEPFPTILHIQKNLEVLEPFEKSHPSKQPDAPPA